MEVRRPSVVVLCATVLLILSPGCGEVAEPLPDGPAHIVKRGFRNTNPAFAPPGFWDRLTFVPSRTWVTTVHPRTVNLPRVDNDGGGFKHNRTSALQLFADIRGGHFAAIHWGTFDMTEEPIEEPPVRLELKPIVWDSIFQKSGS
jgi:hypothetical protein